MKEEVEGGTDDVDDETVNRPRRYRLVQDDVTEDEYKEFYKHVPMTPEPLDLEPCPCRGKRNTPSCSTSRRVAFDMWDRDARHGVKLYVRHVFIMDDAERLMPMYLRFRARCGR